MHFSDFCALECQYTVPADWAQKTSFAQCKSVKTRKGDKKNYEVEGNAAKKYSQCMDERWRKPPDMHTYRPTQLAYWGLHQTKFKRRDDLQI